MYSRPDGFHPGRVLLISNSQTAQWHRHRLPCELEINTAQDSYTPSSLLSPFLYFTLPCSPSPQVTPAGLLCAVPLLATHSHPPLSSIPPHLPRSRAAGPPRERSLFSLRYFPDGLLKTSDFQLLEPFPHSFPPSQISPTAN